MEDQADARSPAERDIVLERTRIFFKILLRAKLGRVDEDRHNHELALATCLCHQADVPGVQSPHGRYETNLGTTLTGRTHCFTNFGNLFYNLQIHCALLFLAADVALAIETGQILVLVKPSRPGSSALKSQCRGQSDCGPEASVTHVVGSSLNPL